MMASFAHRATIGGRPRHRRSSHLRCRENICYDARKL
jgi:hypothetical protein